MSEELKNLLDIPCASSFYTGNAGNAKHSMIISFMVDPYFIAYEKSEKNDQRQPFQRQMCGCQIEAINALKQISRYKTISLYIILKRVKRIQKAKRRIQKAKRRKRKKRRRKEKENNRKRNAFESTKSWRLSVNHMNSPEFTPCGLLRFPLRRYNLFV